MALWTDVTKGTTDGRGIWQAGSGFASDVSGQIIVASGNSIPGTSPSGTISGKSPPRTGSLGEPDVRLVAQSNGELKATDFFAPMTPYPSTRTTWTLGRAPQYF